MPFAASSLPALGTAQTLPGAAAPPVAEASGVVAVALDSSPPPQPIRLISRAGYPMRNAVLDRKDRKKQGTGVSDQKSLSNAERTLQQTGFIEGV